MSCRYLRFAPVDAPELEWVPMGLRESRCALRGADPQKWNAILRGEGVEIGDDEVYCLHNLAASWAQCPLYAARVAAKIDEDE